jgi:SAM-dependent methyltransferase
MKPYEQVVKERYDGREKNQQMYDNIYSIINPIGFNGHIGIEGAIYKIFRFLIDNNTDIISIKVLDVGCGSGWITRSFAEFTGNPSNIVGIDLSEYRIETAKKFSQSIQYIKGNIVEGYEFNNKFDLITTFDVLMHIDTKELLENALTNIYKNLNSDGIFVWYDAYAKDHFDCPVDAECNGFSSKQMDAFAEKAGFKKAYEFSLYKNFFGKLHSVYLYNRFPATLVKLLEKIIPGNPGNIVKIYSVK